MAEEIKWVTYKKNWRNTTSYITRPESDGIPKGFTFSHIATAEEVAEEQARQKRKDEIVEGMKAVESDPRYPIAQSIKAIMEHQMSIALLDCMSIEQWKSVLHTIQGATH